MEGDREKERIYEHADKLAPEKQDNSSDQTCIEAKRYIATAITNGANDYIQA